MSSCPPAAVVLRGGSLREIQGCSAAGAQGCIIAGQAASREGGLEGGDRACCWPGWATQRALLAAWGPPEETERHRGQLQGEWRSRTGVERACAASNPPGLLRRTEGRGGRPWQPRQFLSRERSRRRTFPRRRGEGHTEAREGYVGEKGPSPLAANVLGLLLHLQVQPAGGGVAATPIGARASALGGLNLGSKPGRVP